MTNWDRPRTVKRSALKAGRSKRDPIKETVEKIAVDKRAQFRIANIIATTTTSNVGGMSIVISDDASDKYAVPKAFTDAIAQIEANPFLCREMTMIDERVREFSSPIAAKIAGICANPYAREYFEDALDRMWDETGAVTDAAEVIIGGGLHAAIYASVRVARGFERPLVLEERSRVGGIFSVSRRAAFYLNSRNRPGPLGLPGSGNALNVIPAGPVQPSDLSGDEYQRNTDLALCIRVALAMNARVMTNSRVVRIREAPSSRKRRYIISAIDPFTGDSITVRTDRIIIATGLGNPIRSTLQSERILTFTEFMERMDAPFPLRDMDKIAVLGGGDSGRTVIEALTGQGPSTGMSVAALDFPKKIGWYGLDYLETSYRDAWESCVRSRYRGIGRYFPRTSNDIKSARIQPIRRKASIDLSYNGIRVEEVPYDWAVVCAGFEFGREIEIPDGWFVDDAKFGERVVGRNYIGQEVIIVGPRAEIPFSYAETRKYSRIPENSAALFRYAERTALLASQLDAPSSTA